MNTISFIEILDKLPVYRKREVFNFLEFIYQKTIEEELGGSLLNKKLKPKKASNEIVLKKADTYSSIEEAKRKLKIKYGV